ncbi:MAG: dihydrolipoamide acetyltransferase family protein [Chitinophagales bacterium]|nr:dihydrolipoamide acetyltransferase family protein [Chitinophagales bacterium]
MPTVELIMPKMGESIMEATILKWLKKEGDAIATDESVLEIATDKVDSEVPAPQGGVLSKILFAEGEVVPVGKAIALINTGGADEAPIVAAPAKEEKVTAAASATAVSKVAESIQVAEGNKNGDSGRFYSPLVLNIARSEQISMAELERIPGTGKDNRVTKGDMMAYLENRKAPASQEVPLNLPTGKAEEPVQQVQKAQPVAETPVAKPSISVSGNVEIVEMDRMRKLIAQHMVMSKHTSPHVTSFVEADVTNMVMWREKVKDTVLKRDGEKITFTPIFVEAVVRALKDFPLVNSSLDGERIIIRKDLNIGMATALPSGNLIVPVIKAADQFNLIGLTKQVNDLANRARNNKLKPEDTQGGTFTISNVGTFGNVMGTPIINQPQVAILATGVIKKKPVVIETPTGDTIGIRHMMFLSLSYDHRIVDGALGGSFLRRIADYLEQFDINRVV